MSPGRIPDDSSARCRAVVQEVVALANLALVKSAIISSNLATRGPWTSQPDSSTEAAASASQLSKYGFIIGIFILSLYQASYSSDEHTGSILRSCLFFHKQASAYEERRQTNLINFRPSCHLLNTLGENIRKIPTSGVSDPCRVKLIIQSFCHQYRFLSPFANNPHPNPL